MRDSAISRIFFDATLRFFKRDALRGPSGSINDEFFDEQTRLFLNLCLKAPK
jgi:hypothetical protein